MAFSSGTPTDTTIPVTWALTVGGDGADGVQLCRDGSDGGWCGNFGPSGTASFGSLTAGTTYHLTATPLAGTALVGAASTLTVTTTGGSPPPPPTGWTQVFSDDFTSAPNPTTWNVYEGGRSGASNAQWASGHVTASGGILNMNSSADAAYGASGSPPVWR